jgi:hypothetical protein
MDRRAFISGITLALLTAPLAVGGQQVGKVWRIGFLEAGSSSVNGHFLDAFRQGLSELGYIEGQQISIEDRWAEGRNDRFPGLAAELIRLKVAVIVAASTPATLAAKNATNEIPIVMTLVSDPVGAGLVASLSRPGGNITGLASIANEVVGKQLELLKEARRIRSSSDGPKDVPPGYGWRPPRRANRRRGAAAGKTVANRQCACGQPGIDWAGCQCDRIQPRRSWIHRWAKYHA